MTTENKKPKFDLDLHTYRLLQAEPFFSALSRRINKSQTQAIPTAGVMLNEGSGTFEMIYNPEFFEKLTEESIHRVGCTGMLIGPPEKKWTRNVLVFSLFSERVIHITTLFINHGRFVGKRNASSNPRKLYGMDGTKNNEQWKRG